MIKNTTAQKLRQTFSPRKHPSTVIQSKKYPKSLIINQSIGNKTHYHNQTLSNYSHTRTITEVFSCSDQNCPYLLQVQSLTKQLIESTRENDKLKLMNEYLLKNLSKKSEMITSIQQKYPHQNREFLLSPNKRIVIETIKHAVEKEKTEESTTNPLGLDNLSDTAIPPLLNKNTINSNTPRNNNKTHRKPQIPIKEFDHFEFLTKPESKKPQDHYNFVLNLVKRKSISLNQFEGNTSFLSCTIDYLTNLLNNPSFKQMKSLSQNKSTFVSSIHSLPLNKLENVCEYISVMISDYEKSINLIIRVKMFIEKLFECMVIKSLNDSIKTSIANCKAILFAQKANIYLHDPLFDTLTLYTGENNCEIWKNIPIEKDIVSHTFVHCELQKIHNVKYDSRFNKDKDEEYGFHSKTMLCCPLMNNNGKCFGVIQVINKIKIEEHFSVDDEQLLSLFSFQCADIIQSAIKHDSTVLYINQLKLLTRYSIKLCNCQSIEDFVMISEKTLRDFWGINAAQVVIVNDNTEDSKERFMQYGKNNIGTKLEYTGLLKVCYETKKNLVCATKYEDKAYDKTVDIECCFAIITFPIIDKESNEDRLMAIGQVGTSLLFSREGSHSLSPNVSDTLSIYSRIACNWIRKGLSIKSG